MQTRTLLPFAFAMAAFFACVDKHESTTKDGSSSATKNTTRPVVKGSDGGSPEEGEEEVIAGGGSDGGPGASEGCVNDGDPFDPLRLRTTLAFLASPELRGRQPGEPGDLATRDFVEKRFRCLGVEPGGDNGTYFENFTDSDGIKVANTVGIIPGSDPVVGKEIIVLGAHQDHFGPEGSKTLRLGANDNASGTTMVIHLAQAIRQQKIRPRRTIAFMIFNSEEKGCEGSHHFVDNKGLPRLPLANVVYDLNFDMVGTYKQYGNRVDAHGSMAGSPANAILKSILARPGALKGMTVGLEGLGEDDSDFWAFCEVGIPMVAFFTDDPPCYHKSCDTEEKIDYPNMAEIGKIGAELALGLANGERDLAAFRKNVKVSQLGCGE